MNQQLSNILLLIEQSALRDDEKQKLLAEISVAGKQWDVLEFKLDRTEKVKRSTAFLLEETIEELEQKRKAVEAQNRELEIEAALERVRTVSMGMKEPADMLDVCRIISDQLAILGVKEIRNVQTAIFYEGKRTYMNYEYYAKHDKKIITETGYTSNEIHHAFAEQMLKGSGEFFYTQIPADKLPAWIAYQKSTNVFIDDYLAAALSLNYYWFSLGAVALGISAYQPLADDELNLFRRFLKVFELAYRRYLDIEKAKAQAREAEIELGLERVRARAMAMQTSEELNALSGTLFTELTKLDFVLTRCTIMICDPKTADTRWLMANSEVPDQPMSYRVQYHTLAPNLAYLKAWQERTVKWVYVLQGAIKKEWDDFLFSETELSSLPQFVIAAMRAPDKVYLNVSFANFGNLTLASLEPLSEEHFNIMARFAGVFDLTYTRFNDLKQAEIQAREAQIEAALERVRSRTMAMHKTSELQEVIHTVHKELLKLNVSVDGGSFVVINKDVEPEFRCWGAGGTADTSEEVYVPHFNMPFLTNLMEGIRKGPGFFTEEFSQQEKIDYFTKLFEYKPWSDLGDIQKNETLSAPDGYTRSVAVSSHTSIFIINHQGRTFTEGENDILKRFAKVFDQTYTRFLDLQKAEEQAREVQIQLGLERVQAKAMAMHHSDELKDLVKILFVELSHLDVKLGASLISLYDESMNSRSWFFSHATNEPAILFIPYTTQPFYQEMLRAWKQREPDWNYCLAAQAKIDWEDFLFTKSDFAHLPSAVQEDMRRPDKVFFSASFYSYGSIQIAGVEPFPAESIDIIRRFGKIFELSYTRFLDLKKAEAQAREAKIEAALEKVRSRAMAMQKPDELIEVAQLLRKEMGLLGVEELETSSIYLHDEKTGKTECWYAIMKEQDDEKKLVSDHMTIDLQETWVGRQMLEFYRSDLKQISIPMKGAERIEWINHCAAHSLVLTGFYGDSIRDRTYHLYRFSGGYMGAASPAGISAESRSLLQRAASVFSLAYTRFSDLQQAEAQAKEAIIEAALEKVRGKAMAMHNSSDLSSTASTVFTELRKLGISPIRCGVGLLSKETRKAQLYSATSAADGDSLSLVGWVLLDGHPVLEKIYGAWLDNEDYYPELSGKQLKTYYELLLAGLSVSVPAWQNGQKQYGHFFSFSVGCLYAWSEVPYNDADIKTLKRFASIIDLTFRRYMDLQKSEASAREAVKQAALDRVRADIASMRTVNDLDRITPLIWNELTTLGIPFIRCGVFIMDDAEALIHTFLSTPDGKAIAAFHLPYSTPGKIAQVLAHWRKGKAHTDHWDEAVFGEFANTLVEQGALSTPAQYLRSIPHGGFYLHFLPFLQGMLYVGNTTQLDDEALNLVQSVADAFSTAYARYEDFNKLEAAKQQTDKTLVELRQTQQQLIQAEKMASLGELTAGIAHEIQNPLNFVNNFADINQELVAELQQEVQKGNLDEVKALAADIEENEQKIRHHGKRADAIVKGMLQHSRINAGQRELTDINALVDEYLRLSYHGFRAKDKNFTTAIETRLDKNVERIAIVPQDIGRVLLNLFSNAFYAVQEKQKQLNGQYEPVVSVYTKKTTECVEISIGDNGCGISQQVIAKVFQPFFTTKPTGEGTGLGLSLSYDIVTKGHGGTLSVQSAEGEGSEFVVKLPIA